MSVQLSNEQRLRHNLAFNINGVVSHGLAQAEPQISSNIYYFSNGGRGVLDSNVQDHEGHVAFHFANIDEDEETRLYDANDQVVAVIDWDIHLQPVLKYEGEEIKVKKWISRKGNNTGPIMTRNGHFYEWIQEEFYAVVRSSPEAERKAVIFNGNDTPAVEMTPEGLRDNMLLPIILLIAFTECGLVKGHGFPGTGEDTLSGHFIESFLGVGRSLKKKMQSKRKGKTGNANHVGENPMSVGNGADSPADPEQTIASGDEQTTASGKAHIM